MTEDNVVVCPKCRVKVSVCRDMDKTWFFICCKCGKESERFNEGDDPDDILQICVRWKE